MHDGLLKDIIGGRMTGKRLRGKKRTMMLDGIKVNDTYHKMDERAQDRKIECFSYLKRAVDQGTRERERERSDLS